MAFGRVKLETLFSHATKVECFNLITALLKQVKDMCANHCTTNTFPPRPAQTMPPYYFYSRLSTVPDNFTYQGRASGWERVNWVNNLSILNPFPARLAKTSPFIILLCQTILLVKGELGPGGKGLKVNDRQFST